MDWRVQVLGRLALRRGDAAITRFESRKVAALLAYLAVFAQRPHPREELIELLWPEVAPEVGRNRLRQALSSLRRQLEPPGTAYGSVLVADRHAVCLNPETFTCDAAEFERFARTSRSAEAGALYVGELLPGFYDNWVLRERDRLQTLHEELSEEPISPVPAPDAAPEPSTRSARFLPSSLTGFFGREDERSEGLARLAAHRLITITGLGGGGKTRLAVEIAREAEGYDTVAFVPLAECVLPAQIPEYVRAALRLPAAASIAALDQIAHVLADGTTLLVMDNFEHLVEGGGAAPVEALLDRLPGLRCLVTSRRLLGIAGEQEFSLAPLPLPSDAASISELAENPSIALFLGRARAARPGFGITERNRADLIALCHALEGVPLALELAASRIRALSPAEMGGQIEERFRWLVRSGPGSDKEPRHRSLAAALEWSWRLLPVAQQRFLSALSIFRGGWTADAAASVCAAEDARDRLESLIMDSLVAADEMENGTTRFRMLETVRAFARETLDPARAAALREQHRAAFVEFATRPDAALETESGNLAAALETAISDADTSAALALCVAGDERWVGIVGANTALALFDQALELPGGETHARVATLEIAADLALVAGNTAAASEYAEQALRVAGDCAAARARALLARVTVAIVCFEPPEKTDAWIAEMLDLARAANDVRMIGTALRLTGVRATRTGDFERAERVLVEAQTLLESVGDRRGGRNALANRANTAFQRGDLDTALLRYEACRRRAHDAGEFAGEAACYQNLAATLARLERWGESLRCGREAIRRNHAVGNAYILAHALWNLPEPLCQTEQHADAAVLMGFAERFWTERFGPLNGEDIAYRDDIHARAALGAERAAALRAEGDGLTLSQAVALALGEKSEKVE